MYEFRAVVDSQAVTFKEYLRINHNYLATARSLPLAYLRKIRERFLCHYAKTLVAHLGMYYVM
jgi:hypothetical protein